MRSRWRLAIPFVAAAVLLAVGVPAYYRGRSIPPPSGADAWETVGLILAWLGFAALFLGVVLLAVFGLTRFVIWASRR